MRCVVVLSALALLGACHRRRGAAPGSQGTLAVDRVAFHADGARGDVTLSSRRATLTFATAEPAPGHRPLRGAVVDAAPRGDDAPDPLLWWRPAVLDVRGAVTPLVASSVRAIRCGAAPGVEVRGEAGGARLLHRVCAVSDGGFRAVTTAEAMPPGARLADEINPGSASALLAAEPVAQRGEDWEGEVGARAVVLAERGVTLRFTSAPDAIARRRLVHIARETFPAPIVWSVGASRWSRTLHVERGEVFDALSASHPDAPGFTVEGAEPGSALEWLDPEGAVRVEAPIVGARTIRLPWDHGAAPRVRVRDPWGVASAVLSAQGIVRVPTIASQALEIEVEGGLPARALVRGVGAPDPVLRTRDEARNATAAHGVYLPHGRATVRVAPGTYRVTVTRGTGYTASSEQVTVTPDAPARHRVALRSVIDASAWTPVDLHLHAAPSPDSRVTLEARAMSLACNGIRLAVATDHNRITDYGPALARTDLGSWLTVLTGDEITSAGASLWGHFNAFPLAAPAGAPEQGAIPYYDREPAQLFAAARAAGASILQVNHPRMPPRIGYFDLAGLDAATGASRAPIAPGFDAVEVHNGIWLPDPARVREALVDVIGLARRGIRVAATGNSDAHQLLLEEAGVPRTWVRTPSEPAETLGARVIDALRRGDVTVSAGPLVDVTVDDARPGAVLGPRASVRVRVRVIAPAWVPVDRVEIWRDDEVVRQQVITPSAADGLRWEGSFDVPVTADAAVLAWVDAREPLPHATTYPDARSLGFSSPVWIDADGDGAVRLPARSTPPEAPRPR